MTVLIPKHVLRTVLCHFFVVKSDHRTLSFQYLLCNLLLGLLQQSHHGGTSVCSTVALQHDLCGGSDFGVSRIYRIFPNDSTIVYHAIQRACRHDFEVLFSRIQRLGICFFATRQTSVYRFFV
jgi:hypothetical protein